MVLLFLFLPLIWGDGKGRGLGDHSTVESVPAVLQLSVTLLALDLCMQELTSTRQCIRGVVGQSTPGIRKKEVGARSSKTWRSRTSRSYYGWRACRIRLHTVLARIVLLHTRPFPQTYCHSIQCRQAANQL